MLRLRPPPWAMPGLSRLTVQPSHLLTRAQQPSFVWTTPPHRGFLTRPRPLPSTRSPPSIHPSIHLKQSRSVAPPGRSFCNTSMRARPSQPPVPPGTRSGALPEREPQTLGARMRKMTRDYGWAALGVYLGLSVLDYPLCFLLVRFVGTDKIGEIEHNVLSNLSSAIPDVVKDAWYGTVAKFRDAEEHALDDDNNDVSSAGEMAGWGVEQAEEKHRAEASLGTQLALAYAVHKSFIFVRVPLTAAVLPKVVKVLRSWGWQIGKAKP